MIKPTFMISEDCIVKEPIRSQLLAVSLADGASPKMKVTIIAGAPGQDVRFLKDNVDRKSFIIAADSGYLNCVSAGIVPDLIIGDFDSSKRPETSAAIMQFPSVKNDTDTFCGQLPQKRSYRPPCSPA